jgi:BirA family biotin operon repressor/biotin-[acetyl-CoA-carboxylase] ligase
VRVGALAATRGYRVEHFDSIGSTNDVAMARGRADDAGHLWIVAAEQTGGRGRLGRAWVSPPGNLFASLLLMDPAPVARAPELGFVTGVALSNALNRVAPSAAFTLKWPNDALLDGAKLAGVLLEATTTPGGRLACVIGIGVNCVAHPDGLPYRATDLAAAGFRVTREDLFVALSDEMARALALWDAGAGFESVRRAWLSRAAGLGQRIDVAIGERRVSGVFRSIDERGRLALTAETGDIHIDAGDVILPSLSPSRAGGEKGNT